MRAVHLLRSQSGREKGVREAHRTPGGGGSRPLGMYFFRSSVCPYFFGLCVHLSLSLSDLTLKERKACNLEDYGILNALRS